MRCKPLRISSRRTAAIAALALMPFAPVSVSAAPNDETVKLPPADYGVFGPGAAGFPAAPSPGVTGTTTSYVDPVFGTTVRRITDEFGDGTSPKASGSDIYSKNGFWSADGRLMFHNTGWDKTIINTDTGASVSVDGGLYDYRGFDGSFDPNDKTGGPYHWYYFSGAALRQYVITMQGDGSLVAFDDPTPVRDFSDLRVSALGLLGGSVDWIDNTGRYIVLNVDGEVRVWNKETDTLYSGSVGAAGADWIGISPDGNYVVTSTDRGFYSYAVNHGARTLSTKGVLFWTLCGGHGDLVTATDGRSYLVTFDCYGGNAPHDKPAIYAVNVAPPASVSGTTESGRTAQRTPNRRLFQLEWQKSGDGHMAGLSKGPLRNWVFVSLESTTVTVDGATQGDLLHTDADADWWNRPYIQEIVMANVITGEVRRLAHHRSRSIDNTYYYQPRVSAAWGSCDGPATVAWASNFGREAGWDEETGSYRYADIYALDVAATEDERTAARDRKLCP
jgi:hypothetical protein